jgi:hypothetical protein
MYTVGGGEIRVLLPTGYLQKSKEILVIPSVTRQVHFRPLSCAFGTSTLCMGAASDVEGRHYCLDILTVDTADIECRMNSD